MRFVIRVFAIALLPVAVMAQPAPLPPPTNLQVLPKDTRAQDVVALMQQFTQALGVQCVYCHVQPPQPLYTPEEAAAGVGRGRSQGPPPIDFASDDKAAKQTARAMLTMLNDINAVLAARLGTPAGDAVRVQCVTCHHGVTNPRQIADLLWDTMLGKGDGAAVALYRDLRQKYYGSQAYDFREGLLPSLAERSLALGKPDDAIAWLQLNLEFYPRSAVSYAKLAEAHRRKRDVAAASQDLQKAAELDPSIAAAAQASKARAPVTSDRSR